MAEPVMKYAAVFLIVLSGVTFLYVKQNNLTVVITSSTSCTSACKQNPTVAKATALKKRCVCDTCFCHVLHEMIRFSKSIINWLTEVIQASDVYLAMLQEKAEELFRYTLNTLNKLNQCSSSNTTEFVDDRKQNFKFVSQCKVVNEQNIEGKVNFAQNCNELAEQTTEDFVAKDNVPLKKTCAKCVQRGIKCLITCPGREAQINENSVIMDAAQGKAKTSSGVTSKIDCEQCNTQGVHCPISCIKAKVDSIPSTSNNPKCKKCVTQEIECLEGCPGEKIEKK